MAGKGAAPEAEGSSSSSANSLVYALKERAPRIAMAFAAGQAVWPLVNRAKKWQKDRTTYDITVDGADEIYDDLHAWLLDKLPSVDRRSLEAYSESRLGRANGRASPEAEVVGSSRTGGEKPVPTMKLRYDGARTQRVKLGQHSVSVLVTEGDFVREGGTLFMLKQPKMTFTVSSPAGRDALHELMNELLRQRRQEKFVPSLRLGRPWGDWYRQDELPRRSLESVVLPAEQQKRLVDDMAQFLNSEAEYNRRYIPWHRGYLFEGPPGTGKTSIAKALANHFDMDIYCLPLGDVRSGSTLMELVGKVQPRSVLLLEDIDIFHAAVERDDEADVTMSDLLNAMDGIATPHGLISILTTNHKEVLDEALIRPGRIDVVEHFGLANAEQIDRLLQWFFVDYELPMTGGGRMLAPADVVGAMHRNMNNPQKAVKEIRKMRS